MKKTAWLILLIALVIGGSFILKGKMPVLPIFGTSMEPALKAGSIVTVEEAAVRDVKTGDIIVFEVPEAVREFYNYPSVVAHRVIEINDNQGIITFRTKGDNTGGDPFAIRAQDLRGRVGQQIPYVGFPLLFLQSRQGLIFVILGLSLFAIQIYSEEIGRSRKRMQRGIFSPVIDETQRTNRVVEEGMEGTQRALGQFSSAMEEYAKHLRSHTSAIKGMSEASQELKKGAIEQNKVLSRLTGVMQRQMEAGSETPSEGKPAPPIEDLIATVEKSKEKPKEKQKKERWTTGLEYGDWLE
jgi:signal peptidase